MVLESNSILIGDIRALHSPTIVQKMDSISISTHSELSVSTPSSSIIIIDDDGTKEFFHHSNIKDKIINSRRRHRDEKDDIINSRPQDRPPLYSHNDSIVALIEKKTKKTKHRHRHKEEEHTTIETESRRSSSVSFSTCYVREFDTVIGDNPSVYKGPPIQLGWNYTDYELDVNEYENNHAMHRPLKQLLLNPNDRKGILYMTGKYTTNDLNRATKEANIIKKQRQYTNKTLRNPIYRNVDIVIGRARRLFNRMIVQKKISSKDTEKLDASTLTSISVSAGSCNSKTSILKGGVTYDERRLSTRASQLDSLDCRHPNFNYLK